MEAYGLSNNSPQTSLKRRVQVDNITVGIDVGFENIVNSTTKELTMPMPVLHGAPVEHDVCTEWCEVEDLKPSYIGHHYIQMEANIMTDWNIDALLQEPKAIHLIEIDSVASDSVYTHVTLNDKICHARHWCSNQCDDRVSVQTYWKDQQVAIISQVRCQIGWLWQ